MKAYRSKIGRLPWQLRNNLNQRLRDGHTGADVLSWLNKSPEWRAVKKSCGMADINAQNLSEWRSTGYADWLNDVARSEHIRRMADLSLQFVEQSGGDPAAVGSRLIAGKLLDIIETAEDGSAAALVDAFSSLRGEETKARKVDLAKQQLALREQQFALERKKYQRQTCELFLKWFNNKKIKEIITDRSSDSDSKTEALGRELFGDLWD